MCGVQLVISILFVVLEWSMQLPQSVLLVRSLDDYMTLLERVFKVTNLLFCGINELILINRRMLLCTNYLQFFYSFFR